MEDVSISPLKIALDFAQSKLREATAEREELEARAQEVAQVRCGAAFSTARAAFSTARGPCDGSMHEITASVLQVAIDARALLEAADSPDRGGSAAAQALAVERAEEVAAVAMKAAEVAVKEEMQAQAVVKVGGRMQSCMHAGAGSG